MTIARAGLTVLVLATAALGTASGCGGGSSSSRPLSRAQLTAKANTICQRVIGEVDWSKVRPQDLPSVVGRLAALEEQAAAELERLTPPASMADKWRLIVDGFRATGPEFRRLAQSIKAAGAQAYTVLPLSDAQHERGLEANIAHIKECAKY
jgi:hypothetical protein